MVTSREIRLKSHPVGLPTAENFELATVSVPAPGPGEVQVKNLWMSVDPYMRGRMVARAGPAPAFRVSETFLNAVAPGAIDTDMSNLVKTDEGKSFVLGTSALRRS